MRKLSLILPLAMLAFGGVVVNSQETSSPNTYTQSVTREVLASGYPTPELPQILELVQVQPYEEENQQLRENLQANQVLIKNLQAELKDLQQQVNANQKSVAQAKRVMNELEDLKRKNVYLNNRLYRITQSVPCRIFSCYKF